jgi:hypothetical protein
MQFKNSISGLCMIRIPEFSKSQMQIRIKREGGSVGLAVNSDEGQGTWAEEGMIAGLQTRDDMAQVYKIVKGVGGVNSEHRGSKRPKMHGRQGERILRIFGSKQPGWR